MSIAQNLIPELLKLVAEALVPPNGRTWHSRRDFAAFVQTCRGWRNVGEEGLYRELRLRTGEASRQTAAVASTLDGRKDLEPFVRHLEVEAQTGNEIRLLQRLPELREVTIVQRPGSSAPPHSLTRAVAALASNPRVDSLRRLCISYMSHDEALDPTDLVFLLSQTPHLQHFSLFSLVATPPFSLPSIANAILQPLQLHTLFLPRLSPMTRDILLPTVDFSCLTQLRISACPNDIRLEQGISKARNLVSLVIEGVGVPLDQFMNTFAWPLHDLSSLHTLSLSGFEPSDRCEPLNRAFLAALALSLVNLNLTPFFLPLGGADPTLADFLTKRLKSPLEIIGLGDGDPEDLGMLYQLKKVRREDGMEEDGTDGWRWEESRMID